MAQGAVLITYREILKREPTAEELHTILARYQRRELVILIGQLNCLLETWQNAPNFNIDFQISALLLQRHRREIEYLRFTKDNRVVFSRLSLLYLIKQACIACPDQGLLVADDNARNDLGICCLIANDLLLPFMPSPTDGTIQKVTNFFPFADYIAHDHYAYEIGRTLTMFTKTAEAQALRQRSDFIDLKQIFEEYTGFPVESFCQLAFGCALKFLRIDLDQLSQNTQALFLKSDFFKHTRIEQETVKKFLAKVSVTDEELKQKVQSATKRPANDLTLFQSQPLIKIAEDAYACLDPGFLADKAGRGAFWALMGEIKDGKVRDALLLFWGAVFEQYVNEILAECYRTSGKRVEAPKFANGDEAFDSYLLEGDNIVVLEYKSSTLKADAKYGGDPKALDDDLQLKFIEGHDDKKKGVAQLAWNTERFLQGENLDQVLNRSQTTKLYPGMVCLDSSVTIPYIGKYLNEHFPGHYLRKKYHKVVTPLFLIGISDLENMLGYLGQVGLSEILESYYRNNPRMLIAIARSQVPVLQKLKAGYNPVRERFLEFGRKMEAELFPAEGLRGK